MGWIVSYPQFLCWHLNPQYHLILGLNCLHLEHCFGNFFTKYPHLWRHHNLGDLTQIPGSPTEAWLSAKPPLIIKIHMDCTFYSVTQLGSRLYFEPLASEWYRCSLNMCHVFGGFRCLWHITVYVQGVCVPPRDQPRFRPGCIENIWTPTHRYFNCVILVAVLPILLML